MPLISGTLGLPLLPVRGVLAIARTIQQQAERELTSPANLRRRLEAVEREYGDDADPRAAQEQAEEVEQALGAVVQPVAVLPADPGEGSEATAGAGATSAPAARRQGRNRGRARDRARSW
jgi:Gas vesicle protein G